jgi:hypothetical protein
MPVTIESGVRLFVDIEGPRHVRDDYGALQALGIRRAFDFRGVQESQAPTYSVPGLVRRALSVEPTVAHQMVALVSGAGRGMGLGKARAWATQGARVAPCARCPRVVASPHRCAPWLHRSVKWPQASEAVHRMSLCRGACGTTGHPSGCIRSI